jgi:hypothetical protein
VALISTGPSPAIVRLEMCKEFELEVAETEGDFDLTALARGLATA